MQISLKLTPQLDFTRCKHEREMEASHADSREGKYLSAPSMRCKPGRSLRRNGIRVSANIWAICPGRRHCALKGKRRNHRRGDLGFGRCERVIGRSIKCVPREGKICATAAVPPAADTAIRLHPVKGIFRHGELIALIFGVLFPNIHRSVSATLYEGSIQNHIVIDTHVYSGGDLDARIVQYRPRCC